QTDTTRATSHARPYNLDSLGHFLGGQQSRPRTDNDEVQVKLHQFRGESRIAFGLAVSPPVLDSDVSPIDIAEVPEPLSECGDVRLIRGLWFRGNHDADAGHVPRLLRLCRERRKSQTECE